MTELLPDPTLSDQTKVSARRALTRDRLMAAAVTVFADRGITGASVEEICETAGFTRGAFYSNFADKDALVLALIAQGVEAQYAAAEQAVSATKNAPADLEPAELVSQVLTEFETMGGAARERVLAQQEMLLHAARQPELRGPYLAFTDACIDQLRVLIGDAMRFVNLEFTLPFAESIELLAATHVHLQMESLFTGKVDSRLLHSLIMAITRPAAQPQE